MTPPALCLGMQPAYGVGLNCSAWFESSRPTTAHQLVAKRQIDQLAHTIEGEGSSDLPRAQLFLLRLLVDQSRRRRRRRRT